MEEEDSKIHAVKVNQARRQSEKLDKRKHGRPGVEQECGMCGYIHSSKAECPAKGKKCLLCAKLNHFAKVCKSREKRRTVQYVAKCESGDDARTNETSSESEDEMFYVGCIDAVNAVSLSEWREELTINNKKIKIKLNCSVRHWSEMQCYVFNDIKDSRRGDNNSTYSSQVKVILWSPDTYSWLHNTLMRTQGRNVPHEVLHCRR